MGFVLPSGTRSNHPRHTYASHPNTGRTTSIQFRLTVVPGLEGEKDVGNLQPIPAQFPSLPLEGAITNETVCFFLVQIGIGFREFLPQVDASKLLEFCRGSVVDRSAFADSSRVFIGSAVFLLVRQRSGRFLFRMEPILWNRVPSENVACL